jgi:hypothetical protein
MHRSIDVYRIFPLQVEAHEMQEGRNRIVGGGAGGLCILCMQRFALLGGLGYNILEHMRRREAG